MASPAEFEQDYTIAFRRPSVSMPPDGPTFVHALIQTDGDGVQRRVDISSTPFTIGRAPPSDLILNGSMVSRRHCALTERNGVMVLSDLGSTNGTYVDGERIFDPVPLMDGATLGVGPHILRYQRREAREAAETRALDEDLEAAGRYILSILPARLNDGPVVTDYVYQACARIGGDAFGYQMLDDRHFAVFLLDVSGHGTGAALHAVAVATTMRQRLLPGVDFRDPGAVIAGLNLAFPMETHNELFFTVWYGVCDLVTRELRYATAGHHAGYLLSGGEAPHPLVTRNPAVGMVAGRATQVAACSLPHGAVICLFSDGVFEMTDRDGRRWSLADFTPLLALGARKGGPDLLYRRVRACAQPGPMDDDFSFLTVIVP